MKQEPIVWTKEKHAAIDVIMTLVGALCLLFTVCNEWNLYNNPYGREVRQPSGALESGQLAQMPGYAGWEADYAFWTTGGAIALRIALLAIGLVLCGVGLVRLVHLCRRRRWIPYLIICIAGALLVAFGIFAEVYMMAHHEGLMLTGYETGGELLYYMDLQYNEHTDWVSAPGTVLRLGYWLIAVLMAATGSIGAARSRVRNREEDRVDADAKRQAMLRHRTEKKGKR